MKFRLLLALLSILGFPGYSLGEEMPPSGVYMLTSDYSIKGCLEYSGGRGIAIHCKKPAEKTYARGEEITVDTFFWDDSAKEWGAKVVIFEQFRAIPMKYLKFSR